MKKDTSEIEKLHGHLTSALAIFRNQVQSGVSWVHHHDSVREITSSVGERLKALQDFNKTQAEPAPKQETKEVKTEAVKTKK